MKTLQIIGVYGVVAQSKLTKMSGEGKIKVVKVIRAMKPIHESFEDFRKEASERLKPEDYDKMLEKAQQWQKDGEKSTLTATEKAEINQFFADYQQEVDKCLKEESEKERELSYPKLTEKEFSDFAESNDWTAGVTLDLMDALTEEKKKEE